MKTYVRFVMFEGEVLAVFMRKDACIRYPLIRGEAVMPRIRGCYAHIGQHGTCYDGMEKRKRATPEQYEPLKREMEALGYELEVI